MSRNMQDTGLLQQMLEAAVYLRGGPVTLLEAKGLKSKKVFNIGESTINLAQVQTVGWNGDPCPKKKIENLGSFVRCYPLFRVVHQPFPIELTRGVQHHVENKRPGMFFAVAFGNCGKVLGLVLVEEGHTVNQEPLVAVVPVDKLGPVRAEVQQ